MDSDELKITKIAAGISDAIKDTEPMHRATVLLSYCIEAAKEAELTKEQLIYLVENFFDHPKIGSLIFN